MPSSAPRRWRGGASREARRPNIAPYRQAARGVRAARGCAAMGHGRCARRGVRREGAEGMVRVDAEVVF